jgi:hypothetical protein
MTMHGFKLGGADKIFFVPWKVSQKQISQEKAKALRADGKLTWTFSPKVAVNWIVERKKKVIYHLPSGLYGVMK